MNNSRCETKPIHEVLNEVYIWDFWYHYDKIDENFHVFYLNASRDLVVKNEHHFAAQVGYATTKDFISFCWHNHKVFAAQEGRWDNSSIWTGDIIRVAEGYLMFYTSRCREQDDGLTQNIGAAFSTDFLTWERIPNFRLAPPQTGEYETKTVIGDNTIHAWRDPYLFRDQGQCYMLLTAKSSQLQKNCKGAIALLKSKNNLFDWEVCSPLLATGYFSECEVPQVYQSGESWHLVFSCKGEYDSRTLQKKGGLYRVSGSDLFSLTTTPEILCSEQEGLYACRVLPELDGDIVGFDLQDGGLRRVDASLPWELCKRDFSDISIQ